LSSPIVDIADAVTQYLNVGQYSFQFEAARMNFPYLENQDTDVILVSVLLGVKRAELFSRREFQYKHTIYILIQKKVPADKSHELTIVDELLSLKEEIELSLEWETMAGHTVIGYDESNDNLPFNMDLLKDASIFGTLIGMEYSS